MLDITAGIADSPVERAPKISATAVDYAAGRALSLETLAHLGVASGTTFFPELGRKSEALFFPYPGGWKARSFPEKAFVSGKGFKLSFWNIERVIAANPKSVFITEGEMDACALVEAGVSADRVLSVPNGAKDKPAEHPQDQRGYAYVGEALQAGLNRVEMVVWCGDGDDPGRALRADMAQLFRPGRFSFVEWPEGCKDANDLLRSDGPDALRELVSEGSLPWPVDGLFTLSQIPAAAPLTLWRPGFPEWESKVMLAPRTLSVVTGHPGHGKTQLWAQIWFQVVRAYAVPICMASFETRPRPHLQRILRSLLMGKLERELSDEEKAKADRWIEDRYLFIIHRDQRPTLDWLLEKAEVAVVRHGAKIIQVDPWNRLEDQRGRDETKTDYIGRCLRALHAFAHDMNCHVQILAHPAKMDGARRGQPPSLEDISDSKHWDNMVDQGFVVHRPVVFDGTARKTEAHLYHKKARFDELGFPCKLGLNYVIEKGAYVSTDYQMGYGT